MLKEGSLVLPGDKIAKSEELIAGEGTFEEKGDIIASIIGIFKIDKENMAAVVEPITDVPLVLKKGDIAICEVKQITEAMVIVKIIHIAGRKRQIAGEKEAAIHISNISNEFIEDIKKKFKIGDIVRARIIKVDPAIQLTTKEKGLGVIKAFCSNCRNPLIKKNNLLECKTCGRVEERKMADDYGEGNLNRVIENGDKNKEGNG